MCSSMTFYLLLLLTLLNGRSILLGRSYLALLQSFFTLHIGSDLHMATMSIYDNYYMIVSISLVTLYSYKKMTELHALVSTIFDAISLSAALLLQILKICSFYDLRFFSLRITF
ncbi:hypothetical protein BDF22DRAFT_251265 [Syncephalis plumigaleata]|nr:hypothetical protein BDF22DRAFT_251265 [Syncephalis plumigaleata]